MIQLSLPFPLTPYPRLCVSVRVSVCVLLSVLLHCGAEASLLLFNPIQK